MSEENNIPSNELLSESAVRDIILFTLTYLLVLSQEWVNILLLLLPLITFGFSIFFKILHSNRWRIEFDARTLIYNPLGSEKKHAARLNFTALLQLIFLFWYGAESLYHPQLVDNYYIYFMGIFIFLYTFGFYWIFIDIWKYSGIKIIFHGIDFSQEQFNDEKIINKLDNLISFLKMKTFKKISIINFLIFILLNFLNIMFVLLITNGFIPGIKYTMPGTGIEDSDPILLPYIIYGVIAVPPLVSISFLLLIYRDINAINNKKLNELLHEFPKNIQIKVMENLKAINDNLKRSLRME